MGSSVGRSRPCSVVNPWNAKLHEAWEPLSDRSAGATNADKDQSEAQRSTSLGIFEGVSVFTVSLPSTIAEAPRRPCEAIKIS